LDGVLHKYRGLSSVQKEMESFFSREAKF